MGVTYNSIPPSLIPWIQSQHIFFVASSALPSSSSSSAVTPAATRSIVEPQRREEWTKREEWGYSNVSPKDMSGFEVVNENKVRYQDLTGSGIETIAHMRQKGNARLTIMFVALEGPPRVLRLFGKGKVMERGTRAFEEILPIGDERIRPGCRAVIELDVSKVGTSCGFSIPFFDYVKERPVLDNWARNRVKVDLLARPAEQNQDQEQEEREENERLFSQILARPETPIAKDGLRDYWDYKNSRSRDFLPGLEGLAPVNDPGKESLRRQGGVGKVMIGGDIVEFPVDGTTLGEGEKRETEPTEKSEKEKISEHWAKKVKATPVVQIDNVQIRETESYSGETVLRLLRRERMQMQPGWGWDELVLMSCVLVVGMALGLAGVKLAKFVGLEI